MMIAFLIIAIMMIVSFVMERFNVYKIKEGIADMEEEIIHLKAKLYDKASNEEEEDDNEEEEDSDDDDDDGEEDDDDD